MAQKSAPKKRAKKKRVKKQEPSKALVARETEVAKRAELDVARRMMEVEMLLTAGFGYSEIIKRKREEWGCSDAEARESLDQVCALWRDLNTNMSWREDRANIARARAEMAFRRSLMGNGQDKNRYLGVTVRILDFLAKIDGSYEPDRLEVTAHRPELAHMGYGSEDELIEAIDKIRAEVMPHLLDGEVIDIE